MTPITNPWASKAIVSVTHPDGTIDPNNTVTAIGDEIRYEIVITNVGVAPVTDIEVKDPRIPDLRWARTSVPPRVSYLRPNETWVYEGFYNVTAEDLVDGNCIRNDATADSKEGSNEVNGSLTASTCARVVIPDPTATPSSVPTPAPSAVPTFTPKPSGVPTLSPTTAPTVMPTAVQETTTTRALTAPPSAAPTSCIECTQDSDCPLEKPKCSFRGRRKLLFGYHVMGCCREA